MRNRPQISSEQRYAWRVQDILVGCGLSQSGASPVGGPLFHVPLVRDVEGRPPTQLIIEILPGQSEKSYVAVADKIAYNLGVAKVNVVPLGPYLIRLDLTGKGLITPIIRQEATGGTSVDPSGNGNGIQF